MKKGSRQGCQDKRETEAKGLVGPGAPNSPFWNLPTTAYLRQRGKRRAAAKDRKSLPGETCGYRLRARKKRRVSWHTVRSTAEKEKFELFFQWPGVTCSFLTGYWRPVVTLHSNWFQTFFSDQPSDSKTSYKPLVRFQTFCDQLSHEITERVTWPGVTKVVKRDHASHK